MDAAPGVWKKLGTGGLGPALVSLAVLMLLSACSPAAKSDEELRKEIQALKAEITVVKEKVTQLEAGQQTILTLLKRPAAAPESPVLAEPQAGQLPLSVSQLIKEKDQLIGTRVTVKGLVGPVLMHHKSLFLRAPEGMVEVFFGNLDKKLVDRLSSTVVEQPVTVTGVVSQATKGGAKLQITAEAVEF